MAQTAEILDAKAPLCLFCNTYDINIAGILLTKKITIRQGSYIDISGRYMLEQSYHNVFFNF